MAIWANGNSEFTLWSWLLRLGFLSSLLAMSLSILSVAMLLKKLTGSYGVPTISDLSSMMRSWWKRYVTGVLSQIFRTKSQGRASYWPIWFSVCACGVFAYGLSHANDGPIVEKSNVQVISQLSLNKWMMKDDQGQFLYTACDDFPNSKVIWPGYVARKVRWQEFGSCKSIRRQDLGFWWLRDDKGNVITIALLNGHD